ncbi:MAG TPA: Gfo/Idh/MocA family oxidoreductase [Halococcus sp.]|nr:Gfo/Idh/MocA family oxidoreductase [Halococcus sp.]
MPTRESDREGPAYRFGIVGFGWLGAVLGEQLRDHERTTAVGVADVSTEAREKAADELDLLEGELYENYQDLLRNEELDAVVVSTPHAFHYEQVTAALDAGLDVLCEKPLCIDPANAKEITDRIENSERTVMVGYQRHLSEPYRTAREHLADSKTEITHVDVEITQPYMDLFGGTWRTDPELSGGGVIMDTGNHLLDGMLWTTGLTPTAVSAQVSFVDDECRVDEAGALSIEFENGVIGSASISGRTHRFSEHLHVYTENDAIYFDESAMTVVDGEGETDRFTADSNEEPTKIESFVEALDTGVNPPATARDSFRASALTAAAYESARTGERVEIDLE